MTTDPWENVRGRIKAGYASGGIFTGAEAEAMFKSSGMSKRDREGLLYVPGIMTPAEAKIRFQGTGVKPPPGEALRTTPGQVAELSRESPEALAVARAQRAYTGAQAARKNAALMLTRISDYVRGSENLYAAAFEAEPGMRLSNALEKAGLDQRDLKAVGVHALSEALVEAEQRRDRARAPGLPVPARLAFGVGDVANMSRDVGSAMKAAGVEPEAAMATIADAVRWLTEPAGPPEPRKPGWARALSAEERKALPAFGERHGGGAKGMGFFGPLDLGSGNVATELTVQMQHEGKSIEIPTLVPVLSRRELETLLDDFDRGYTTNVERKVKAFARARLAKGKSPFIEPGEKESKLPGATVAEVAKVVRVPEKTADPFAGAGKSPQEKVKAAYAPGSEGARTGDGYRAQPGDNIYTISIRMGTTPDALRRSNPDMFDERGSVKEGARVVIPADGKLDVGYNVRPQVLFRA